MHNLIKNTRVGYPLPKSISEVANFASSGGLGKIFRRSSVLPGLH
jgi:hypothetical protein